MIKKTLFFLFLMVSSFLLLRGVDITNAQNTTGRFKCEVQGGLCVGVSVSCNENYQPNFAFCSGLSAASCASNPEADCIPNFAPGTTFKCTSAGSGLCAPCAAGETCGFTDPIACGNDAACKGAPNPGGGGGGTPINFEGKCDPVGGKAGEGIQTAIGCVPIGSGTSITTFAINWGIGIAGGVAILFISYAGFMIMTSQGDPKRLQAGQELMTSAISGVILIIFSIFILRTLGVTVLGIF